MVTRRANYGDGDAAGDHAKVLAADQYVLGAVTIVGMAAACAALRSPPLSGNNAPLIAQLSQWGRSPDIYATILSLPHDAGGAQATSLTEMGTGARMESIRQQLSVFWRIDCFPKPLVSLIDDALPVEGVGLSSFGTHRVAGEGFRFAVPPIGPRGTLPLGGIAYLLSRMPNGVGMYLALTGGEIGAADAYATKLVTHVIPTTAFAAILNGLADGQPVDPLLDGLHRDPEAASLAEVGDAIARCFSGASIADIKKSLAQETGAHQPWARATLRTIEQRSPAELAASHRLVTLARALDVRESLILTFRVALQWSDATTDNVDIADIFSAPKSGDLSLPLRAEIATGRF